MNSPVLTMLPMAVATTTPAVRKPQTENPLDLELMLLLLDVQSEPDTVFPFGKYWYLRPFLHIMLDDIRRMQNSLFNMMSVVDLLNVTMAFDRKINTGSTCVLCV